MKSVSDFLDTLSSLAVKRGVKAPQFGTGLDDKSTHPNFGTGSSDGKKPYAPNYGVYAPVWFAGEAEKIAKSLPQQSADVVQPSTDATPASAPQDPDQIARQIILDHPDANGAAFYNALQAKGLMVVHKQADSSGAFPQVTRAKSKIEDQLLGHLRNKKTKQANPTITAPPPAVPKKESMIWKAPLGSVTLKEGTPAGVSKQAAIGATKFKVTLLKEGMGNFNDRFYYSKQAIESAVPVFEGKKIYADHPSMTDEAARPERSVRDILGHFEGLHVETSQDGEALLIGEATILPSPQYQWARDIMLEAIAYAQKYPTQELVGLSINAAGDAEEMSIDEILKTAPEGARVKLQKAQQDGIDSLRICTVINDAISCDLVTEAGAGGKINAFMEGRMPNGKKGKRKGL